LVAHGAVVHDVALRLVDALEARWATMALDRASVAFGAAIHDIGKVQYPEELTGPGHHHEQGGQALLISIGVSPQAARFCLTHGAWQAQMVALEDLLVALADTCWKGARNDVLEQQVIAHIQAVYPEDPWETLIFVDQLVEDVAARADERLVWQARFPPTVGI
jgi:hypothetical protein